MGVAKVGANTSRSPSPVNKGVCIGCGRQFQEHAAFGVSAIRHVYRGRNDYGLTPRQILLE